MARCKLWFFTNVSGKLFSVYQIHCNNHTLSIPTKILLYHIVSLPLLEKVSDD